MTRLIIHYGSTREWLLLFFLNSFVYSWRVRVRRGRRLTDLRIQRRQTLNSNTLFFLSCTLFKKFFIGFPYLNANYWRRVTCLCTMIEEFCIFISYLCYSSSLFFFFFFAYPVARFHSGTRPLCLWFHAKPEVAQSLCFLCFFFFFSRIVQSHSHLTNNRSIVQALSPCCQSEWTKRDKS